MIICLSLRHANSYSALYNVFMYRFPFHVLGRCKYPYLPSRTKVERHTAFFSVGSFFVSQILTVLGLLLNGFSILPS